MIPVCHQVRRLWAILREAVVQRCSVQKMFLKISQNPQGNTRARVFFNKLADLRLATLFKKRLRHRCFQVDFAKFLRTPFLQTICSGCFWKLFHTTPKKYCMWIQTSWGTKHVLLLFGIEIFFLNLELNLLRNKC